MSVGFVSPICFKELTITEVVILAIPLAAVAEQNTNLLYIELS